MGAPITAIKETNEINAPKAGPIDAKHPTRNAVKHSLRDNPTSGALAIEAFVNFIETTTNISTDGIAATQRIQLFATDK